MRAMRKGRKMRGVGEEGREEGREGGDGYSEGSKLIYDTRSSILSHIYFIQNTRVDRFT